MPDPSRSPLSLLPRHLAVHPKVHLVRPLARLQPIQAKAGKPSIDVSRVAESLAGIAVVEPVIPVASPAHWAEVVRGLGPEIDAILPVSIPAYPTEVWNSHPQPLVERGLPLLFWYLMDYEEPDFWRWSARDMLRALGVQVHIVKGCRHGEALVRGLALKRFLRDSRLVVFGEQNFPWNATAASHLVTKSLGTRVLVRPIEEIRARASRATDAAVDALWRERRGRYVERGVAPAELRQALRTFLSIRSILEEEKALGFGVNCFGDLIPRGGRDVPCLAQMLAREEGYIASCDGDYCAMMSMVLVTWLLDRTCMMSNMYPVSYVGALRDHFGDPLSPPESCPREEWQSYARLAHCGFVGVVSPEMTPEGKTTLRDWGGTYEMKRDGRGCGADGDLASREPVTIVELGFDGKRLLLAQAEVVETTRHPGMPHCESSALLRFRDLPGFVERISREHTVVAYGDWIPELTVLAGILGLEAEVF
jgi:L-fucose isomerase-like protein